MKAIVIIYQGETPTKSQVENILNHADFVSGNSSVSIIGENKLAGLIVKSVKAPKLNTEEGDQAAIYIAGMCRDTLDVTKLSIDIISNLAKSVRNPSPETDAFVRACSIIAQRNPVSLDTRQKYNITDKTIEIITKLYQAWTNEQN